MSAVNNLVDEWDAINHPIAWNDKLINLDELFGKNIYVDILKSAREINPNVKLYVNDGGILPNGNGKFNQKKRDKYEKFIRYLLIMSAIRRHWIYGAFYTKTINCAY